MDYLSACLAGNWIILEFFSLCHGRWRVHRRFLYHVRCPPTPISSGNRQCQRRGQRWWQVSEVAIVEAVHAGARAPRNNREESKICFLHRLDRVPMPCAQCSALGMVVGGFEEWTIEAKVVGRRGTNFEDAREGQNANNTNTRCDGQARERM